MLGHHQGRHGGQRQRQVMVGEHAVDVGHAGQHP